MRINEIEPVYCELIPEHIEKGKLYVSELYGVAIHLCACGCGGKSVTPINTTTGKHGEWTVTKHGNNVVTLNPSIGNWSGESPYHAHYFIRQNTIIWV